MKKFIATISIKQKDGSWKTSEPCEPFAEVDATSAADFILGLCFQHNPMALLAHLAGALRVSITEVTGAESVDETVISKSE